LLLLLLLPVQTNNNDFSGGDIYGMMSTQAAPGGNGTDPAYDARAEQLKVLHEQQSAEQAKRHAEQQALLKEQAGQLKLLREQQGATVRCSSLSSSQHHSTH
jgi:hypothetical protein